MCVKVCLNGGTHILSAKIIAKDNLNIENLMQTFEMSKTAQQNSEILHKNSHWVCVIKVCSSGGPNCIIGLKITQYSLNIEGSISEH